MAKIVYIRKEQAIIFEYDDGTATPFECRDDFVPGQNDEGQERESLPNGNYIVSAEDPGSTANGPAYGTFYIETGDPRERDIHGGGSGLADSFAPRQGWVPTYGCLRMQNADGEALSRLIIDAGNAVPLEVRE